MSDDFNNSEPSSGRIDRIPQDVEKGSSISGILVKIGFVTFIYVLAALLFKLPPFPDTPELICKNLAAVSSETKQMTREVAVVISPTDTFLDFGRVLDAESKGIFENLVKNDTKLTVVLADGSPKVITSADVHADSGENLDIKIRDAVNKIKGSYECVVSDRTVNGVADKVSSTAGHDILGGLRIAAKSFDPAMKDKQIIVISNGLQTSGMIRLQEGGIPPGSSGAKEVVSQLKETGSLADLNNAFVTWVGLGQTDGVKQQRLDTFEIYSLESFWSAIVSASGGLPVDIAEDTLPDSQPNVRSIPSQSVPGIKDPCIFVEAGDDEVKFVPDSPTFLNPIIAERTASKIADQIRKRGCSFNVTITGYVASSTSRAQYANNPNAGCQLSLARANAFKTLLVGSGVNVPIRTAGGCKGPSNDWDASGNFVDSLGARNRIVTVSQ